MAEPEPRHRFRFEERTSAICDLMDLPRAEPELKRLLRRFLALLGELARRLV